MFGEVVRYPVFFFRFFFFLRDCSSFTIGGSFKYFSFLPLPREMIQFDYPPWETNISIHIDISPENQWFDEISLKKWSLFMGDFVHFGVGWG